MNKQIVVKKSLIQGYGVFAARDLYPLEIITDGRTFGRTYKKFKGYNHSCDFNAVIINTVKPVSKKLKAYRLIKCCLDGIKPDKYSSQFGELVVIVRSPIKKGTEITVSYGYFNNKKCNCPRCRA